MRKLILSWLLAAVAIGGCVAYSNKEAPPLTPFEEVCLLAEVYFDESCGNLRPPTLIYTSLLAELSIVGAYVHGEQYIFVHPRDPELEDTVIHETVHYVLWELDLVQGRCYSENVAREWSAIISGLPVDDTWRERYEC